MQAVGGMDGERCKYGSDVSGGDSVRSRRYSARVHGFLYGYGACVVRIIIDSGSTLAYAQSSSLAAYAQSNADTRR